MIRKILTLAGALAAAVALTVSAPAQEIKLTFADQNSPTGWGPAHALYPWVKQVEEATKGRVKIEVFPSQTLIKGIDMWKGVSSGIADIGWCVQGYWPEQTPLSDVMSLPFLPIKTAEQGSEVLWKLYEKYPSIQKEYGAIQPLVLHTTSPNFLITAKKQVKTLEDMKGLKIAYAWRSADRDGEGARRGADGVCRCPTCIRRSTRACSTARRCRGRRSTASGSMRSRRTSPSCHSTPPTSRSAPTGRRSRACPRTCAIRS